MELRTDVPALLGYLDNLDEVGSGVDAHTLHASGLVFFLVFIVELIAMAMALMNGLHFSIGLRNTTVGSELALIGAQSHGATHLRDAFLFLHDVDNVVRRVGIHFSAVGILVAQDIAGKLDDHHLHTETDAEGRNIVRTGVFRSDNLAFDATLTKASSLFTK